MPRIRTVKPDLAAHEGMYDLEVETGLPMRFAWVMLFTCCDREGRFKWLPRTLKAAILPHDNVEFSRVLDAWGTRAFVAKYRVGNHWFGCIPTWSKHQVINNRESASDIPSIEQADEVYSFQLKSIDASLTREARDNDASGTRQARDEDASHKERKGKEGEGKEGVHEAPRAFSDADYRLSFDAIKAAYPPFAGGQDWIKAEHHWRLLLDDGCWSEHTLLGGVERYAKFVENGGVSGPTYVMTPGKFFSSPEKYWNQAWEPPLSKTEAVEDETIAAGQRFLAGSMS